MVVFAGANPVVVRLSSSKLPVFWQVAARAGPANTAPSRTSANFQVVLRIVNIRLLRDLRAKSAQGPARVKHQ
jgi:hypothetical protein